jgi:hypothetical protein
MCSFWWDHAWRRRSAHGIFNRYWHGYLEGCFAVSFLRELADKLISVYAAFGIYSFAARLPE